MATILCITLIPMLTAIGGQNKANETPAIDTGNIFLAIVLDTRAASAPNWTRMKSLASQATDYLRPGDKIEILSAQPGKPRLHRNATIDSPEIARRQDLRECIAGIQQTFFLFEVDIAKAVAVALDDLGKQCDKYKCCLLVASDGCLTDSQINQVRILAAASRARGWPFCITASDDATRQLLMAGSRGELEVTSLRQANLAQWFEKVRHSARLEYQEQRQPAGPTKLTEAKPVESLLRPSTDQRSEQKCVTNFGGAFLAGVLVFVL